MVAKACHPSHDQEVGDWLIVLPFSNKELKDLLLVARVLGGESLSTLKLLVDRPGTAEFMVSCKQFLTIDTGRTGYGLPDTSVHPGERSVPTWEPGAEIY